MPSSAVFQAWCRPGQTISPAPLIDAGTSVAPVRGPVVRLIRPSATPAVSPPTSPVTGGGPRGALTRPSPALPPHNSLVITGPRAILHLKNVHGRIRTAGRVDQGAVGWRARRPPGRRARARPRGGHRGGHPRTRGSRPGAGVPPARAGARRRRPGRAGRRDPARGPPLARRERGLSDSRAHARRPRGRGRRGAAQGGGREDPRPHGGGEVRGGPGAPRVQRGHRGPPDVA